MELPKIGDKLRVRRDLVADEEAYHFGVAEEMTAFAGEIVTVTDVDEDRQGVPAITIEEDDRWYWSVEMFEPVGEDKMIEHIGGYFKMIEVGMKVRVSKDLADMDSWVVILDDMIRCIGKEYEVTTVLDREDYTIVQLKGSKYNWEPHMLEIVDAPVDDVVVGGFKVGDKVTIVDNIGAKGVEFGIFINPRMKVHAGKEYTIVKRFGDLFQLDTPDENRVGCPWMWSAACFKDKAAEAPEKPVAKRHNPQAITTLDKLDNVSLFRVGGLFEGKARVCRFVIDNNDKSVNVYPLSRWLRPIGMGQDAFLKMLDSGEVTIMCIERD